MQQTNASMKQSMRDERTSIQGDDERTSRLAISMAIRLGHYMRNRCAFFFGNGLAPVWWLTWLGPLPALVLAPRVSKRAAFAVAFAGFCLGAFTWWTYLHRVLELPLMVFILASVTPSIFFGLGVLLARTFLVRGSLWRAAFAFPAVWTSYEYLNALASRIARSEVSPIPR